MISARVVTRGVLVLLMLAPTAHSQMGMMGGAGMMGGMGMMGAMGGMGGNMWGTGMWPGMQSCNYPYMPNGGGAENRYEELNEKINALDQKRAELRNQRDELINGYTSPSGRTTAGLDQYMERESMDYVLGMIADGAEDGAQARSCEKYYETQKPSKTRQIEWEEEGSTEKKSGACKWGKKKEDPEWRVYWENPAPATTDTDAIRDNQMCTDKLAEQPFRVTPTIWNDICSGKKIAAKKACSEEKLRPKGKEVKGGPADCERTLNDYSRFSDRIRDLSAQIAKLEVEARKQEQIARDREIDQILGRKTSGGMVCPTGECDGPVVQGPKTWQVIGAAALDVFGILMNTRTQNRAMDNAARLGWPYYPYPNSGYGFPFATAGLYGATMGGIGAGGFGCGGVIGGGMMGGPFGGMGPFGVMGGMYPGMGGPFGQMGCMNPMMCNPMMAGGGLYLPGMGPWGMAGPWGMNPYGGMMGGFMPGGMGMAMGMAALSGFPGMGFMPGGMGMQFPGGMGMQFPGGMGMMFPGGMGMQMPGAIGMAALSGFPGMGFMPGGMGMQFPGGMGMQFPGGMGMQFPGGMGMQMPGAMGMQFPGGMGMQFPGGMGMQFPGGMGMQMPGAMGMQFPGGMGMTMPGGMPGGMLGMDFYNQMMQQQMQQYQLYMEYQQRQLTNQQQQYRVIGNLQQELMGLNMRLQQAYMGLYNGMGYSPFLGIGGGGAIGGFGSIGVGGVLGGVGFVAPGGQPLTPPGGAGRGR